MRRQDVRKATFGVGRGVYVAPWMGPNGETIIVAIGRDSRIRGWRLIAVGENHVQAGDDLWQILDREDPVPALIAI